MSRYDDIINLPHHVSPTRKQMSMHDRAAQFAPFSALVGYDDAVAETARLTENKRILEESELEQLNRRMCYLVSNLSEKPEVSIEYFIADDRKSGGAYVTETGTVKRISIVKRLIYMESGNIIPVDAVSAINSNCFIDL